MKNIELNELVAIASKLKENEWHFHFMTPVCAFNESSMYKIVLETKDGNYHSTVSNKPVGELKKLENLFYNRG